MPLSPDEIERYARHIVLSDVGGPGQLKLKGAVLARLYFNIGGGRDSGPLGLSMMTSCPSRTFSGR